MIDESTAREGVEPQTFAETPAFDAPGTAADAPQVEDSGNDADAVETLDNGEAAEAIDEIEFDFGGNSFKVRKGDIPEELASEIAKFTKGTWADYTRRTQAVVEHAKSLQVRERAVDALRGLSDEALSTYSRGVSIKEEIAQLSSVDLNALWQSAPDQARRVSDRLSQKQAEFQAVVNRVAETERRLEEAQQAEMARRAAEGEAQLERRIKGFSQKVPEVIDYVSHAYGIPKEHAARVWRADPASAEMAYKAMMWDRAQNQARKPASKPDAVPVAPMRQAGRATGERDIASMPMAEYAEYMNRRERQKAASGHR